MLGNKLAYLVVVIFSFYVRFIFVDTEARASLDHGKQE